MVISQTAYLNESLSILYPVVLDGSSEHVRTFEEKQSSYEKNILYLKLLSMQTDALNR